MKKIEEAVEMLNEGDMIWFDYVSRGSNSNPIKIFAEYSEHNSEMRHLTLGRIFLPIRPLTPRADSIFETKLVEYDEIKNLSRFVREDLFGRCE